jgi:septum site-determining protein MinC
LSQKSDEAFKLKANFYPVTVIKFFRCDQRSVLQQLKEIQRKAPNYFYQSPVIVDVTHLKRPAKGLDLARLSQILREYQLIPVGVQGLSPAEESSAEALGLALWQSSAANKDIQEVSESAPEYRTGPQSESESESDSQPQSSFPSPSEEASTRQPSKWPNTVVTKPVRSGMRLYAKQSNLILLAPVSSGAECIADGDIFCYAPVRGRILAGASGDLQAQIFCQSLDAELIAIAGYYLLYDECPPEKNGCFQILLKESKLYIHNFSLERSVLCQK